MPTTGLGITYPASTDNVRLWEHLQQLAEDVDALLTFPDKQEGFGNGVNTLVSAASTWADMPTYACTASITNPHPTLDLVVDVRWSAWMYTSSASAIIRMCPRISGAMTVAAGIGGGLAYGWGQIPRGGVDYEQFYGGASIALPASGSAYVFTMQGYRESTSGSPTHQINYPTLEIVPLHYQA